MQKNSYTVEIHAYPKVYTIECYTVDEAKAIAHAKWHEDMNGASIYETVVDEND